MQDLKRSGVSPDLNCHFGRTQKDGSIVFRIRLTGLKHVQETNNNA